ncbi:MAG: PAS domain S-box protein [Anaerolineae bacterium]|nr:PAS domain S-box protein [Anaerolineae bacterium]
MTKTTHKAFVSWLTTLGGIFVLLVLCFVGSHQYLLFHSITETLSVVVLIGVFIIFWNTRQFVENPYFLFIGAACLFIGSIDMLHMLAYKGMGVFSGYDANLPTQLWIAGRYLHSLSFLAASFLVRRKLKVNWVLLGFTIVTLLLILSIFYWGIFPDCFVEGQGLTPFKRISEYIISFIFLLSVWLMWRRRRTFERPILLWISGSLLVAAGSELAFTLYIDVYGFANLLGHILKIVWIYFLYRAFVEIGLREPYSLLFRGLKQSETALRASEERYRLISRIASDYFYSLSVSPGGALAVAWVAGAFEQITGYATEDMSIDKWAALIHPDDLPLTRQITQAALAGQSSEFEYRIRTRTGEVRWLLDHNLPIWDAAQGRVTFILGAAKDITERKRAEEVLRVALEESRQRRAEVEALLEGTRAILEPHSFAVAAQFIFDACKNLIDATSGYVALLTPDGAENEVLFLDAGGLPCTVDPELPMPIRGLRAEAYRNNTVVYDNTFPQSDWMRFLPNGHVRLENVLFAPLAIEGQVVGLLGLANKPGGFTDHDARMASAFGELAAIALRNSRTLDALQESEARYRSLFEDSPISLWAEDFSAAKAYIDTLRAAGVSDLRGYFEAHPEALVHCAAAVKVFDVNQATLDLFRAEAKPELFGGLGKFFERESYEVFREELVALAEGRPWFESETVRLPLVGLPMPCIVRVSIAPGYEKTWSKVLASVIDITERKRAEAERERLVAALDAFAHTVAHDLKNPLNGVIGFAEILEIDLGDSASDDTRHCLQQIVQSGGKMQQIIDELLLLASVRRLADVKVKPLNMGMIVHEALGRLSHMIEQRRAEIVLPDTWPTASGYAPWIEAVWVNYISNALKYGGQPPRVELGAGVEPAGMIRFWVQDNGRGLDSQDQARLFTPFTRLEPGKAEGYGLGLSIVQRIVERLGGQVSVESQKGQGSRFSFTLPVPTD